jgi:hypothetical protein
MHVVSSKVNLNGTKSLFDLLCGRRDILYDRFGLRFKEPVEYATFERIQYRYDTAQA